MSIILETELWTSLFLQRLMPLSRYLPAVLGEKWKNDVHKDRNMTHMSLSIGIKQNSSFSLLIPWRCLMICICLIFSWIHNPAWPHSLQLHTALPTEVWELVEVFCRSIFQLLFLSIKQVAAATILKIEVINIVKIAFWHQSSSLSSTVSGCLAVESQISPLCL